MIRPVLGGCWGEARHACLRTQGDFQWHGYPDPVFVETCSCAQPYSLVVFSELCTKQIMNLQCGASVFRAVTLCADVACLAWVWRMRGQAAFAPAGAIGGPLLFETMAAKEAKETVRLRWKSPRLFIGEAKKGLQCGLSGNRVARMGNAAPRHRRGNRLYRQREVCCGENQPVPKP